MTAKTDLYEADTLVADVNLPTVTNTTLFTSGVHGGNKDFELWEVTFIIDLLTPAANAGEVDLMITGVNCTFNGPQHAVYVNSSAAWREQLSLTTVVAMNGGALTLSVYNGITAAATAKAASGQGGKTTGYYMNRIA